MFYKTIILYDNTGMFPEKRIEWKWNNGGENCERSKRTFVVQNQPISYDSADNAIKQSLEDYNVDTLDIDLSPVSLQTESQQYNKREDLDSKMSDRQLVFQRGTNPFTNQTSYVDDIIVRDMFLKPINTTSEKLKTNNYNDNNE
jgi:hypothetical protein